MAILEAVADLENADLQTLSQEVSWTLYDVVDPEALDQLLTTGSGVQITFSMAEYRVVFESNRLTVTKVS